jgi:hypothetical protein
MPTRFPVTTRNSPALKASGAGPNATLQCTIEESTFLRGAKEIVAGTAPGITTAPVVSGTASQGNNLTSTQGTFTGSNLVYENEWQISWDGGTDYTKIPWGNGALTFALTAAHVGSKIRCRVTARNGNGKFSSNSNATATIT